MKLKPSFQILRLKNFLLDIKTILTHRLRSFYNKQLALIGLIGLSLMLIVSCSSGGSNDTPTDLIDPSDPIDVLTIRWTDGDEQVFNNVTADQLMNIQY